MHWSRDDDVRQALLRHFGRANSSAPTYHMQLLVASPKPTTMPILVSTRKIDHSSHYAEMRSSVFCLAPAGWAQWTVRFFEAVQLGCIPVTFALEPNPLPTAMPFASTTLDYSAFSVNVPPRRIPSLRSFLQAMASNRTHLRSMQRALWLARSVLDWTDLSESGVFQKLLSMLHTRQLERRSHGLGVVCAKANTCSMCAW